MILKTTVNIVSMVKRKNIVCRLNNYPNLLFFSLVQNPMNGSFFFLPIYSQKVSNKNNALANIFNDYCFCIY